MGMSQAIKAEAKLKGTPLQTKIDEVWFILSENDHGSDNANCFIVNSV